MDISTLVLAVDLSEASRVAGLHAIGLARQLGARLVLLNVDEIGAPSEGITEALAEYLEQVETARTRWLADLQAACADAGVDCEVASVVGEPDEGVLEYLESHPAQLLVMGRSGAGSYRRFMLGSTTKRVLHHVEIPTLVVPFDPEHDQAPAGPVAYRALLTTTDFSPASDAGLSFAYELSRKLAAPLTVLHVERSPLVGVMPEEPLAPPTDHLDALRRDVETRLQESLDTLTLDRDAIDVAATVGTSAGRAIVEAAEELGSDLIVIPSSGKGRLKRLLMGSTTDHVLGATEVAMLVLPRPWLERSLGEPVS